MAGRLQIIDSLALRGNYTYTDSRQLSGSQEGQPLTNTAEHMSNITLDWDVNTKLNVQLTSETRSARFRGAMILSTTRIIAYCTSELLMR